MQRISLFLTLTAILFGFAVSESQAMARVPAPDTTIGTFTRPNTIGDPNVLTAGVFTVSGDYTNAHLTGMALESESFGGILPTFEVITSQVDLTRVSSSNSLVFYGEGSLISESDTERFRVRTRVTATFTGTTNQIGLLLIDFDLPNGFGTLTYTYWSDDANFDAPPF